MSTTNLDKDKFEQLAATADVLARFGDKPVAANASPVVSESKPAAHSLNGAEIAGKAKEQMIALTGLSASTVSGLCKDEQGWHVVLDMVELRRIPPSSDVLANYDVVLDGDGNLISYRRTRRYYRGSTEEDK
jgi:hypothetical protein